MFYYGTHNSGTAGPLVWWQWIFTWIFQLVSKCQNLSIKEQLEKGVKVFNLQIVWYNGAWHFSHGLCVYKEKLKDAISLMNDYSTENNRIYFQLYLDKNFFLGQNKDRFYELVEELSIVCSPVQKVIMLTAWIEGTEEYVYSSGVDIKLVEKYWTLSWGKMYGKEWIDKLPLPYRHAKIYNSKYKSEYKDKVDYLMLDFFEIS